MALDSRGYPILAWHEEQNGGLRSLHVARWDGSAWSMLGPALARGSDLYSLEPQLAYAANGEVWIAWSGGTRKHSCIRVARWDGKAWRGVGRITSGQTYARPRDANSPRISMLPDGQVLVAWLETDALTFRSALALARWTGRQWQPVSPPAAIPDGEEPRQVLSIALAADASPLLVWSEIDSSDSASVYLQRLSADGWQPLITALHLNPDPEYAKSVAIAASHDAALYVAWDEPDAHDQRTRLVHVHPCASGETPVASTTRRARSSYWPKTVEEAVERIVSQMDAESKARLRAVPRADLAQFHLTWGMGIRNGFGLHKRNAALLQSCGSQDMRAEDCSMIIMQHVWDRLHDTP
jgi:hypothetical protein